MKSLVAGQAYRNHLGAVVVIRQHAIMSENVIGDIWLAEAPDKIFGPKTYLVTRKGLKYAGYKLDVEVTP